VRRSLLLVALWLATAVGAVVLAWQGVRVVADQVTDDRPPPLAAGEIEAELAEAATSTSTPSSTTAPSTVVTTTTRSSASPPPVAAAETRTYNVRGGTAALRFAAEGVTVVFANPAEGFTVDVEPEHGNGIRVEFESASHESRVDGWWADGPVDRVQEDGEDPGGDGDADTDD
jgi:hypothetical protein